MKRRGPDLIGDASHLDRRRLFGLFGGAAVGALAARAVPTAQAAEPIRIAYDVTHEPVETEVAGVIMRSASPTALWPGVKEWLGRHYEERGPDYEEILRDG